ncbi:MAG: quinone-dependent dihydroorotate dehydrogenase [Anaerolineales bacterium]|nr:quinone-dependent dihydroorotate dehydrogenase [Anaerolineales bacterium]
MYARLRPLIFRSDPEQAHAFVLQWMRLAGAAPPLRALLRAWFAAPGEPVQVFGLDFPNPVGLAAGYDKDGLAWRGLACLGFGHIEVGTVTLQAQPGNPKPRLFRLPEERALINRMGFPGAGAGRVAPRLRGERPHGLVLGVNLGKNKDTPFEDAARDYLALMDIFAPLADYLAINVSSPNTVGLRRLQARQALDDLLGQLSARRQEQQASLGRRTPLLVKLAPDLTEAELDDALDVILQAGMDGVIAANTTLDRDGLGSPLAGEAGGLSGAPLEKRSTQMVLQIYQRTGGKLPIVAVGGVMCAADARAKLDAGASLVQIYTGLVYAGPGLVGQINRSLMAGRG